MPLGGTGEYGSFSQQARIRFVELAAKAVGGDIPVVPGVLDTGFHDVIGSARDFANAGADALLVITPYYTNPTQMGIRDYFLRYADESAIPILIYEIPYRTRISIDPAILHELSSHEKIIGMKACNTDMYHYLRVLAGVSPSFTVMSGEDSLFPLHVAAGAKGGIVVTANLFPKIWRHLFELACSGKTSEAIDFHRKLIPFLDLVGVDAPRVLQPLRAPKPELRDTLRKETERLLQMYELSDLRMS